MTDLNKEDKEIFKINKIIKEYKIFPKLPDEVFAKYFEQSNNFEDFWKKKDFDFKTEDPEESKPSKPTTSQSPEESLKPLDEVFLDDKLKDDVISHVSIPELIYGEEPGYSGVILFGPPGTGKTVLLRAIGEVYARNGAYAKEISTSEVNSMWVGQFAKNLEEQLKKAVAEAKKRKKPSFLSFDEGSILAQKANEGSESVAKHYQEAIDVLKRYVGNSKELVIAISTNVLPESFEDALTREGRLTSYFIGYPDEEQRKRMWKHFAQKYKIRELTNDQAQELAKITPLEQGAFVEEFCRNYMQTRRQIVLREKGCKTLVEALKKKIRIDESDVKKTMTFEQVYEDLKSALDSKYKRNGVEKEEKKPFGFADK